MFVPELDGLDPTPTPQRSRFRTPRRAVKQVSTHDDGVVECRRDIQKQLRWRIREAIQITLQEKLSEALGCGRYERNGQHYRNGSQTRRVTTAHGLYAPNVGKASKMEKVYPGGWQPGTTIPAGYYLEEEHYPPGTTRAGSGNEAGCEPVPRARSLIIHTTGPAVAQCPRGQALLPQALWRDRETEPVRLITDKLEVTVPRTGQ